MARAVATGGGELLWEVDDEPVAQASARAVVAGMSRIGPVYTPPEHRNHGYAAAVTAAAARWALDQGARHVLLYTDLANPTTNRLYPRLGFRPRYDVARDCASCPGRPGAARDCWCRFGRIACGVGGAQRRVGNRAPGGPPGRVSTGRRPDALARLGLTGPRAEEVLTDAGLVGRRQARPRRRERHVGAGPQPRPGPRAARSGPARGRGRAPVEGLRRRAAPRRRAARAPVRPARRLDGAGRPPRRPPRPLAPAHRGRAGPRTDVATRTATLLAAVGADPAAPPAGAEGRGRGGDATARRSTPCAPPTATRCSCSPPPTSPRSASRRCRSSRSRTSPPSSPTWPPRRCGRRSRWRWPRPTRRPRAGSP